MNLNSNPKIAGRSKNPQDPGPTGIKIRDRQKDPSGHVHCSREQQKPEIAIGPELMSQRPRELMSGRTWQKATWVIKGPLP